MIKAVFILDWHGRGETEERIGSIEIVNTGANSARPVFGDYRVRLKDHIGHSFFETTILDHHREQGFWPILSQAMKAWDVCRKVPNDGKA